MKHFCVCVQIFHRHGATATVHDDGELHNKNPPTPCLWQAPAAQHPENQKTRPRSILWPGVAAISQPVRRTRRLARPRGGVARARGSGRARGLVRIALSGSQNQKRRSVWITNDESFGCDHRKGLS